MKKITTNKRAMVNQLQAIAMGIIALVVIVGIGIVTLTKIGDSTSGCNSTSSVYDTTLRICTTATYDPNYTPAGTAFTSLNYGVTQLGSTGLLSWLPAIIALLVGVFFLMYFAGGKGAKGRNY